MGFISKVRSLGESVIDFADVAVRRAKDDLVRTDDMEDRADLIQEDTAPADAFMEAVDRIPSSVQVAKDLSKIYESWQAPQTRESVTKAVGGTPAEDDFKAYFADPRYSFSGYGYVERPGPLSFDLMRAVALRVPVIAAIHQTRVHQVASYCVPQLNKFEPGFRVALRDKRKPPNNRDLKRIDRMTTTLLQSGATSNYTSRPGLSVVAPLLARDSYTYDQVGMEIKRSIKGNPLYWKPVDGGSLRLHRSWALDPGNSSTKTVQVLDGRPVAEFGPDELAFDIRNFRTDLRSYGYGLPEVEMAFTTITHWLWAVNHNALFFKQGTTQPGILNLKGRIPTKQLRAFRRFWYQMVSGNANAWRSPVVSAEQGIEWIPMNNSNRDMEFSAWTDYLVKVIAAIYLTDPVEINFKFGTSGQRQMFGAGDKAKVNESRERGLRPILRFLERFFNENLIWPIDDTLQFEFVGLMNITPKEYADLLVQRVRSFNTVNEVRAELDFQPLPYGDIPFDANYLAHIREVEAMRIDAQTQGLPSVAPTMGQNEQGHQSALDQVQLPKDGHHLIPGDANPLAPPDPRVGSLPGEPADEAQIKQLEALLKPREIT